MLEHVHNVTVRVKEWEGDVIFLHDIVDGAASHSYGINVAMLAGLPPSLLEQARAKLADLEALDRQTPASNNADVANPPNQQLSLFGSANDAIVRALSDESPMNMTPLQALERLEHYRQLAAKSLDPQKSNVQ